MDDPQFEADLRATFESLREAQLRTNQIVAVCSDRGDRQRKALEAIFSLAKYPDEASFEVLGKVREIARVALDGRSGGFDIRRKVVCSRREWMEVFRLDGGWHHINSATFETLEDAQMKAPRREGVGIYPVDGVEPVLVFRNGGWVRP